MSTYTLTDGDRALIAEARAAFATDWVYLERLLWQARARLGDATPGPETVPDEPVDPQAEADAVLRVLAPVLVGRVTVERGCWVWQGNVRDGAPIGKVGGNTVKIRRWLHQATHLPTRRKVLEGAGCAERCVHPGHAVVLQPGVRYRTDAPAC